MTGNSSIALHGKCQHCTKCNVQTGIGWNPVFFCEREGHAASVGADDGCEFFEREPGSDDEKGAQ